MNDIDPTKMTDAERMTLFASFTKDMTPAVPTRRMLADLIAPWLDAITDARAKGYDWKQLSGVLAANLSIKIAPVTLQKIVHAASATAGSTSRKRRRRRRSVVKPSAPARGSSPAATLASTSKV